MSDEYQKNVGFVGGVSLLVSSITGPGLVTIPYLFQQAGWLLPILAFSCIMFLTGVGALFLVEALTKYPGNQKFDKNIEITTLVRQFYGDRVHNLMQVALYFSMQSINIASIIISIQTFDNILIVLFGQTCGFGLYPRQEWICVHQQTNSSSPFTTDYMLVTLGYAVLLVFVVPLASMRLTDNILIQFISLVATVIISLEWVSTFAETGFDPDLLPTIGPDLTQIVGSIMFNYAFITTVPSWLNSKHPSVPVKKTIWVSLIMATFIYILIGLTGGSSYRFSDTSNIMSVINSSPRGTAAMQFANFMFPVMSLIISIPVYIIIVRVNLIQSKVCGKTMATFLSSILPFFIVVPFQTGAWINSFMNWTSLIFTSTTNFIFPYLIYIFLARRKEFRDDDGDEDENAAGGVDFLDYDLAINTIQLSSPNRNESSLSAVGEYRLANSLKSSTAGGLLPNMRSALAKSRAFGGGSRFMIATQRSTANLRSRKSLINSAIYRSRDLADERQTGSGKELYLPRYSLKQLESESRDPSDISDAPDDYEDNNNDLGNRNNILKTGAMQPIDLLGGSSPQKFLMDPDDATDKATRQPAHLTMIIPDLIMTPPSVHGSTQNVSGSTAATIPNSRPLIDFDSPSMEANLEKLDREREQKPRKRPQSQSQSQPAPPVVTSSDHQHDPERVGSAGGRKKNAVAPLSPAEMARGGIANNNSGVKCDNNFGISGGKSKDPAVKRRRRKRRHSEFSPLPKLLLGRIRPITMAIVCCTIMSILVVGTIIYAVI